MKFNIYAFALIIGVVISHTGITQDRNLCGITAEGMQEVQLRVKENILSLIRAGKLDTTQWKNNAIVSANKLGINQQAVPTTIRFEWPMKPKNPEEFEYYHIGNYIDLDSGDLCFRDYMGGRRTYDTHQGTDIGIGPYGWKRKIDATVYAVAAAEGIVVEKLDGEFDEQCTWSNGAIGRGNHVVILHDDGKTVSYYMHLRNGSITQHQIGDRIYTGDILGSVASSGNSTGPHLHFQINVGWEDPTEEKGIRVDPWAGPSNYTTSSSLWVNQKPYDEPAVYGMETHATTNIDSYTANCDKTINLGTLRNSYVPGEVVGSRIILRDWVDGSKVSVGFKRPDGTNIITYINIENNCTYSTPDCGTMRPICRVAYVEKHITLPADAPSGTWALWINFNGQTYYKYFSVGCAQTLFLTGVQAGSKGYRQSNTISSSASIAGLSTNKIEYHADDGVTLTPGFRVSQGGSFRATNYGCTRIEN